MIPKNAATCNSRIEGYQSYLLRLWKDQTTESWRASLQDVRTNECHNFADVSHLLTFIYSQVGYAITEMEPEIYDPYRQTSQETPLFHTLTFEEV